MAESFPNQNEKIAVQTDAIRKLHIAICGTRGIPACYGGFETFAEELAIRLVENGHDVRVYGRSHVIDWKESHYRGAEVRLLPAPQHKYFETPVHSLFSFLDLLGSRFFRGKRYDVVLVCNGANSPFIWILRLFGFPVIVNVDGIERNRGKWNWVGKLWYCLGEFCSVLFATRVVSDAEVIREYYQDTYRCSSVVIPYGYRALDTDGAKEALEAKVGGDYSGLFPAAQPEIFEELGITAGGYLLYVSRLEPENNAHLVIDAYNSLPPELKKMPLVIVGGAPYADEYIRSLKKSAGEGVIFAGFRFGEAYVALQLGAYLYFQATEVGGTHPALVEAMGFANCVIANQTPENVEVLDRAGDFFLKNDVGDLKAKLALLLQSEDLVKDFRQRALERALSRYEWSKIVSDYEGLFYSLCRQNRGNKP